MTDFYVVESGAPYPQSYAATMPLAEARRDTLAIEYPGKVWEIIECDAWLGAHEASYLERPIEEISAERFDDMLNCLPPCDWRHVDGLERFYVSELVTGRIANQYGRAGTRYFHKFIRVGDVATYLDRAKLEPFFRESVA